MLTGETIVAVCSLIGTALGSYGGTKLISYRIEQLEKKVEKHNSVVERMAVLENRMDSTDRRVGAVEKELED